MNTVLIQGGRTLDLERLVDLYQRQGRSAENIAREIGHSPNTVRRHLRAAGVELGPQGQHRLITDEYVSLTLKMRAEGTNWEDIAEKIGFSTRALQRAVAKYALSASMARETALQARLNSADQEIDDLRQRIDKLSVAPVMSHSGRQ
ncbi:hypothetical protein NL64_06350 [Pseudomonas fluorescens]|uniref:hypothetical protein n=1 Tax=Pseudomonas fluorescens TaxID=294 RepID=UPI00054C74D7|nr:hypothetical protein [Pseudomonas fluorescens]KII34878.1 hypothetical protein NL64_06350 [Pseudomonas fluorescens]